MTCIFLHQTKVTRATQLLEDLLDEYSTPASLHGVKIGVIEKNYSKRLGLFRRAGWLVRLGDELVNNPLQKNVLICKSHPLAGYVSEVVYLPGVGDYASNA